MTSAKIQLIAVLFSLTLCSCRSPNHPASKVSQQQPTAKQESSAASKNPKSDDSLDSDDESKSLDERLMDAARDGDTATVVALIRKGANVNARQKGELSETDFSPLMLAVEQQQTETVKTLLMLGADIHRKGTRFKTQKICEDNITALSIAVGSNYIEIARLLLDKGADAKSFEAYSIFDEVNPDDITTWRRHHTRRTPLVFLAQSAPMLALLLDHGADPNAVESVDRDSCLMEFAMTGNRECVQLLIDRGANVAYRNRKGQTALDFARKNKYPEIVKLLSR